MMLTRPKSGIPFGVTLLQFLPPFRVTWIIPSSEPAQSTFTSRFEGPSAKTTA